MFHHLYLSLAEIIPKQLPSRNTAPCTRAAYLLHAGWSSLSAHKDVLGTDVQSLAAEDINSLACKQLVE